MQPIDRGESGDGGRRLLASWQHNLAQDRGFNEFQVILCRNVLIYFDKALQNRVHRLFYESLARFGTLCLGNKESIRFSAYEGCYEEVDAAARMYRRIK